MGARGRFDGAERGLAALKEWNGYAPTAAERHDLGGGLDRRLAQVTGTVSDAMHIVGTRNRGGCGKQRWLRRTREMSSRPRLIHRAHAEVSWFLYVPACALVEAPPPPHPGRWAGCGGGGALRLHACMIFSGPAAPKKLWSSWDRRSAGS